VRRLALLWLLAAASLQVAWAQPQRTPEELRAYINELWSRFTPQERDALAGDLRDRQRRIERQTAATRRETARIDVQLNSQAAQTSSSVAFDLLKQRGEKQSELIDLGRSMQVIRRSSLAVGHLTRTSVMDRELTIDRAFLQLQLESISIAAHPSYLMCPREILDKARMQYWTTDLSNFENRHIAAGEAVGRLSCSRGIYGTTTCTPAAADAAQWRFETIGTAFVVRSDLMVTNRHVVQHFAVQEEGIRWRVRPGFAARVEFPSLYNRCSGIDPTRTKVVSEIFVHPGEDIAILRFAEGGLPAALVLYSTSTYSGPVALIGYPDFDQRVPRGLQDSVFRGPHGDVPFGVRRIQPGRVTLQEQAQQWRTDASALNGNSGSPVLFLGDARVVGIHKGGYPGGENVFIGAAEINRLIQLVP